MALSSDLLSSSCWNSPTNIWFGFQVLREKLKYAIHFCKSIDTDDYARIALTGDPLEDASDDDGSESDGIESVTDSDGEIVESDEE